MPESKKRKPKRATYTPPPTKAARNRPPSPPWYGALILVLFLFAVVWIVGYTIGPLPGQTALGGWNYLIAIGAAIGAVGMLTSWR
ncbi:MAG TPA: cell division protein CrgA [Mycobacteriales bacterium]|nr:cell division protein CrgA [Mycobacteriales bacterium]